MLTSKQRAYLRALGHKLDPIFQIGKAGLSGELLTQLDAALKARELIKVRVLKSCGADPAVLAEEVAQALDSDLVDKRGRNFLLYREAAEEPRLKLP